MIRLIAMRHAKSSWSSPADDDHARPLNERGRHDAPRMADALVERGWVPELVLSSDATRTRQTWELMRPRFESAPEVRWLSSFYHGRPDDVLDALQELHEPVQTVMALGHNPGWEALVTYLSGQRTQLTTANCALLELEDQWAHAAQAGSWTLHDVLRPRDLD